MKSNKNYNKALKRKREFSARGSNCPICKRVFRDGCNHSVIEAHERLDRNLIDARIRDLKEQGRI